MAGGPVLAPGTPRARGAGKKNERPRTSAESIQKAPTHLLLFSFPSDLFFKLHFQAFLTNCSSKTPPPKKIENVLQKNEKIPFHFLLGEREREPLNGLILIEATYRALDNSSAHLSGIWCALEVQSQVGGPKKWIPDQ
jgi:hypothetical protein